mmetsp:Transcript_17315/g.28456  ORF Transcript_17315/g.28456 Transcript_17315/m.28456 type:complete len:312 (+) Transcript_17315:98-1033(+)
MNHHETTDDQAAAALTSSRIAQSISTNNLPPSSPDAITIDDDPFSSLTLLDPSHEISQSSKEAGRIAGRTSSFNEGRSIGRTKGWEVGLELGYMSSFCAEILTGLKTTQQQQRLSSMQEQSDDQSSNIDIADNDDESASGGSSSNMQQSAQNKSSSTSSSNRMNSRLDRCTTLAREIVTLIKDFPPPQHLLYPQDDSDDDVVAGDSRQQLDSTTKVAAALDISTSIQRIRAKFKLLCVLLKTSQSFDIKRILELKGERSNDDKNKNDNDGVADVVDKVKSVELHQDNADVGVVRSRKKYDIEHKSNGGGDW